MTPVLVRDMAQPLLIAEDITSSAAFDRCVTTASESEDMSGFVAAWALERQAAGEIKQRVVAKSIGAGPAVLEDRTIWTWFGRLPSQQEQCRADALRSFLSADEQCRMDRFRFAQDRWSYAASHAALRFLLGKLLDCAPREVRFVTGPNGKPFVDAKQHGDVTAGAIHFNMAHTRGMVGVALASSPVGIDVEPVRELPDMRDLTVNLMAPETLETFDAFSCTRDKVAHFFRHWTLSEAYIKATGEGVGQGLSSFAFTSDGPARLARSTPGWGPAERWEFGILSCDAPSVRNSTSIPA